MAFQGQEVGEIESNYNETPQSLHFAGHGDEYQQQQQIT